MAYVRDLRVVLAGGLLLSAALGGCYKSPTEDEDALELDEESSANVDLVQVVPDAGAPRCSQGDAIAQLLCNLTPPPTAEAPAPAPNTAQVTGLVDGLGGLLNIAGVLGAFLGTTPQQPMPAQPGLVELVNLAGGLGNIAAVLNGVLGGGGSGQGSLADLFAAGRQQPAEMTVQQPSLLDWLAGLGIPQQGPAVSEEPSPDTCAAPKSDADAFLCALRGDAQPPPQ